MLHLIVGVDDDDAVAEGATADDVDAEVDVAGGAEISLVTGFVKGFFSCTEVFTAEVTGVFEGVSVLGFFEIDDPNKLAA